MRRLAPRRLETALEGVTRQAAPSGTLARVQAVWDRVAGPRLASEAAPVAERRGVVTVRCSSAVWAQELELLAGELRERLNGALEGPGEVQSMRFVVGSAEGPRAADRDGL
jgi:predicted nucleic acid-binding Zn ribbon protein